MPFYHFIQNNSFGHFDVNDDVTNNVIIEAANAQQANRIAETVGIYFDGCDDGFDCSCCGDRWSRIWDNETGDDEPMIYSTPVTEYGKDRFDFLFVAVGSPYAHVYYLNGDKSTYTRPVE